MSLVNMRRKLPLLLPVLWLFLIIFVGGIAFTGLNSGGSLGGTSQASGAHILAKVGGHEVTNAQMASILTQYENMFGRRAGVAQQAELPQYAWQQIINEYATAEAARSVGVSASQADAEAEIARGIDQTLEQIAKGSTREQLADYRARMRAAQDVEQARRGLLGQRLQEKLTREARPVELKVAHILVRTGKLSDADARRKAADVARQARAGAEFARLAKQHSEDALTRDQGGVKGWVSAQPPPPPLGKDVKPDPNAAQTFDPGFTAAALLLQRPGAVSEPVPGSEGYHVLKVLEERNFQPKPEIDPKNPKKAPDPKKQQEAVEQYRQAVASTIARGLVEQYRTRLENQVEPHSAWLRGHLAEQELGPAPPPGPKKAVSAEEKTRARQETQKIGIVTAAYTQAMKDTEPASGAGLAYKLAQLHLRAAESLKRAGDDAGAKAQQEAALAMLEKWSRRSGDASTFVLQGETLEKLGRKSDAVKVYADAIERSGENAMVLGQVSDKLKSLGRSDLADKARAKQSELLAKQAQEAAERKKREDAAKAAAAKTPAPVPPLGPAGSNP